MLEALWADLRQGFRVLRRSPGFASVALLSLALGIGANTTVFSLINATFLHPLPYRDPDRLVSLYTTDNRNALFATFLGTSYPNYLDYRDQNEVFSDLLLWGPAALSLIGRDGEPQELAGQIVSGNYFAMLGVKAALGRTFLPEELDGPPAVHPVIVLSYGVWKRRFGGDPSLIGKTLTLNNHSFTLVGIAPEGFHGLYALAAPDFWVHLSMHAQALSGSYRTLFNTRRSLLFNVLGRLKPGVTVAQADAAMKTLAHRLARQYPRDNENRSVALIPLALSTIHPNQRGNYVVAGSVLVAVVGLVLLIACANLANLLLARGSTRQKEIAIRCSLGAGRMRMVRQLMTESILLALLGGAAGMLVAVWARKLLLAFPPPFLRPGALEIALDTRVLAFTLAASFLTGLLFGLAPALHASRPQFAALRVSGSPRLRMPVARALVASQVALTVVAVVGAGLFLRSLRTATRINPGFETEKMLVMSVNLRAQGYDPPAGQEYYRRAVERVSHVPGVRSAALSSAQPLAGGFMRTVLIEGQETGSGGNGPLLALIVSAGYFATAGVPILQGRGFEEGDRADAPPVAVVNEQMAKRYWPNENPLGRRFRFFGSNVLLQVAGIARNAKYLNLGESSLPCVYLSLAQNYNDVMTLHVRTAGPPAPLVGAVRRELQNLDRNLPILSPSTVSDLLARSLWGPRMGAVLLSIFGFLALGLAAIGVYGVVSFSVSQRRQEIGIRLALGAQQQDVLRMVLREAVLMVLVGLILGLMVALAASRVVAGLLFDVSASDPAAFAGGCAVLLAVALAASYFPARRAAKVDPLVAIRYE